MLVALPTILVALLVTLALPSVGIEPAIVHRVRLYLLGHAPGVFAFIAFLTGKSFLQAHSETRPAIVAAVLANIVNVVACVLLVLGDDGLRLLGLPPVGLPQLGALGAGIASSLASGTMALVALLAASRHRPAGPPDHVPLGSVFRLALPVGMQLLAEIGIFALVGVLAGRLGPRVVSAHQIALGLASFTFMGSLGIAGATAVRVGHAIGAGRSPRRAGLLGIALGLVVMSAGAITFAIFPHWLISLFTPDPEIIAIGVPLLRIAAFFQLFDGIQAVAAGALRGAGDVRFPFLANVAAHWLVGFPIAMLLGFGLGMGALGMWLGLTAGLVVISGLLTLRFLRVSRGEVAKIEM
jgi:MATE family multidrug resistance protein